MPIFPCPNCSQPLAFDENYSGVGFKCPLCSKECIIAKPIPLSHETESSPQEFNTPRRSWGEFHPIRIFSQIWKIKGRSKIFGLLLVLLLGGGLILKRNDIAEVVSGVPSKIGGVPINLDTPEKRRDFLTKLEAKYETTDEKIAAKYHAMREMNQADFTPEEKQEYERLKNEHMRISIQGVDLPQMMKEIEESDKKWREERLRKKGLINSDGFVPNSGEIRQ